MHAAQDQQDETYFGAQALDRLGQVRRLIPVLQGQRYVTDVHQIEADRQQVVDRVGQSFVAQERVDQKDPAVLDECPRDQIVSAY